MTSIIVCKHITFSEQGLSEFLTPHITFFSVIGLEMSIDFYNFFLNKFMNLERMKFTLELRAEATGD